MPEPTDRPAAPLRTSTAAARVAAPAWAAAAGLALLGLLATVGRAYPPVTRDGPLPAQALFDADVLGRVAAWQGSLRTAVVVVTVAELATVVAVLATPPGRRLLARLGAGRAPTLRAAAVVALLVALVGAPVRFWVGYLEATAAGLRVGGVGQWLADWALATGLRVGGVALGVAGMLWLARRAPRSWPALVTVAAVATAAATLLLEPVVTTELLLDPRPLEDPTVLAATRELVDRSTLAEARVVVGDASRRTTTLNAYVTGLGPTRTVVVFDTLLARPVDEVAAVVAHELAHAEADDPLRGVLGSALLTLPLALLGRAVLRRLPGLPLRGARTGALAVLLVLLAELALAPPLTWQSRRVEAAADARAVELVGDATGLVAVTRQFVDGSLADPAPPPWWQALRGTHPAPADRIRNALATAAEPPSDPVARP